MLGLYLFCPESAYQGASLVLAEMMGALQSAAQVPAAAGVMC